MQIFWELSYHIIIILRTTGMIELSSELATCSVLSLKSVLVMTRGPVKLRLRFHFHFHDPRASKIASSLSLSLSLSRERTHTEGTIDPQQEFPLFRDHCDVATCDD